MTKHVYHKLQMKLRLKVKWAPLSLKFISFNDKSLNSPNKEREENNMTQKNWWVCFYKVKLDLSPYIMFYYLCNDLDEIKIHFPAITFYGNNQILGIKTNKRCIQPAWCPDSGLYWVNLKDDLSSCKGLILTWEVEGLVRLPEFLRE